MNSVIKLAAVAVLALSVGVVVGPMLPASRVGQAPSLSPSPVPSATPAPLHQGSLAAGDYSVAPFAGDAWAPCGPAEDPCPEAARDDAIRFTFTVPDGWAGAPLGSDIWLAVGHNSGPDGAGFLLGRGGWLYSEPCGTSEDPDVPVGPTVADLVDAVVDHPQVEATEPVAAEIDGRPATYFEIQGPADLAVCPEFMVWAPSFHAQGPDNRWLVWVLDVDGVRIVITGSEFPGTPPGRSAELREILRSIRIDSPLLAERFAWPFEYSVPTGTVVTTASRSLYAFTEGSTDTYPGSGYEDVRGVRGVTVSFGMPAGTHAAGDARGGLPLRPEAFFEDLRGNPAVSIGPVASASIGGLAARRADVHGVEGWGGAYPDLHMGEGVMALNFPGSLTVAEIEGGSLVVHIWAATEEELAVWRPIAAGIVESIRFIEPPPTPRPAASPEAAG